MNPIDIKESFALVRTPGPNPVTVQNMRSTKHREGLACDNNTADV